MHVTTCVRAWHRRAWHRRACPRLDCLENSGVVFPAGLDAESFSTGVLAALSHSLRALLAERGHLTAAAPLADELMAEVPTAVAPLAEEVPMLAAEPRGRRLRRQQTGTSALLVLRQERRACRIGALRRKGALTCSACAGLPMMMMMRGSRRRPLLLNGLRAHQKGASPPLVIPWR